MHFRCGRCPNEFCSGCGQSFKKAEVIGGQTITSESDGRGDIVVTSQYNSSSLQNGIIIVFASNLSYGGTPPMRARAYTHTHTLMDC